jgi:GntR family transcriptional regulator
MSFPLRIDLDSAVPIYAQIERRLRALLGSGHWEAGDRLPSVRETAVRLRVNPLTVVKAYRILQDEGLLESRPGAGIYAARVLLSSRASRRQAARKAIEEALDAASAQGLSPGDLAELFEEALRRRTERARP